MTSPAGGRDPRQWIPWAMVAGGVAVVLSGPLLTLVNDGVAGLGEPLALVNLAVFSVLGGLVVACGVALARTGIGADRYRRAALWPVGVAVGLLALNAPLMLLIADIPPSFLRGWASSMVGIGAAGGAIIGLMEARAIERARAAEREAIRAETARAEADYLDYVNSLLRHEVLNAINIINGYATIGEDDAPTDAEDYFRRIRTESADIADVIDSIRVLNEVHKAATPSGTVDLSDALQAEVAKLEDTFDVVVETSIPSDVAVVGDELLPRAFWNLLSNAVEHNESSSPAVEVSVEQADDVVEVRIADNGPGFSDTEHERLFERSRHGNHGMGLYLVKRLVERSGGTVELAETGPDGSVFTVTLPRA